MNMQTLATQFWFKSDILQQYHTEAGAGYGTSAVFNIILAFPTTGSSASV